MFSVLPRQNFSFEAAMPRIHMPRAPHSAGLCASYLLTALYRYCPSKSSQSPFVSKPYGFLVTSSEVGRWWAWRESLKPW